MTRIGSRSQADGTAGVAKPPGITDPSHNRGGARRGDQKPRIAPMVLAARRTGLRPSLQFVSSV